MNTTERQAFVYIQFWSILGPFLLFSALVAALITAQFPLMPSIVMVLVGGVLCWKWKRRGFMMSLPLIAILLSLSFLFVEREALFWMLGMTAAIAFGLWIMVLGLEEAEDISSLLSLELQQAQGQVFTLQMEKEEAIKRVEIEKAQWHKEFSSVTEQLKVKEKLVALLNEEQEMLHQQKERLQEELVHKTQGLQSQLDEAQEKLKTRQHELSVLERQVSDWQEKASRQQQLVTSAQDEARLCHQQIALHVADLEQEREKLQGLQDKVENLTREKSLLETTLERIQLEVEQKEASLKEQAREILVLKESALESRLPVESEEVEALKKEKHRTEALLKQLRDQFDEKNEILSETRYELFHTKEKLFALVREKEELERFGREEISFERYMVDVMKESEEAHKEVEALEALVTKLIS